jgi:hypothetical protein
MERELAAWNKKLGQQTGATAGDERLARILAGGGIGAWPNRAMRTGLNMEHS